MKGYDENEKIKSFFSVMIVGNNPKEIIEQYDANIKSEPYIKYRISDAKKMREKIITAYTALIDKLDKDLNGANAFNLDKDVIKTGKEDFQNGLSTIKGMSDFEYYSMQTGGMELDDEGNALSTENVNGKYNTCQIGDKYSAPLILNNGDKVFSALNKNINWNAMHLVNSDVYRLTWKLLKGEIKPSTDEEKSIYNNMISTKPYLNNFKDIESYIKYNTSYWNYAYVDKNGWFDIEDNDTDYDWVANFYNNFVVKLKDDDLITIYECSK